MRGDERSAITGPIPPEAMISREWAAVMHVLTSPALLRLRATEHVDSGHETIDVTRLLELAEAASAGEQVLLRAACDLFNGSGELVLSDLIWRLDEPNLRCVLEAIELRRGLHSFSLAAEEGW
jgi:hypothetical protein